MSAAVAEIARDDLGVREQADSPESFRLWAVRESAYLDARDGTDSNESLFELLRRFPAEARALLDAYIDAYDLAVANGRAE